MYFQVRENTEYELHGVGIVSETEIHIQRREVVLFRADNFSEFRVWTCEVKEVNSIGIKYQ